MHWSRVEPLIGRRPLGSRRPSDPAPGHGAGRRTGRRCHLLGTGARRRAAHQRRAAPARRRPDARDRGRRRSHRDAAEPAGDPRRLDHAGLHERRRSYRTDRSWPTVVAHELGLVPQQGFRYPAYEPAEWPGRAADRPRAGRAPPRTCRRRPARLVRGGEGGAMRCGATWTGSRTSGRAAATVRSSCARRPRRTTTSPCTAPTSSTSRCSTARIIDARLRDRPHDDLVEAGGRARERPCVAGGAGRLPRTETRPCSTPPNGWVRRAPASTASRRWS